MGLEMFLVCSLSFSNVTRKTETELDSLCKVTTHVQLNFKESFGWLSHHLQMEQSNCINTTIFQLGWHSS